jgi:methionine biosynthesis protein MetW
MVRPLVEGRADAVFGSRMMSKGEARKGGMPLYKYVGNKTLTRMQNALVGTNLSEFHSGYRAYSTAALREIDFDSNSDGFDFDTEIILQLHDGGHRIFEIPIPTYYGDEICYVNGMRYARDVLRHSFDYRLSRAGLNVGIGGPTSDYPFKASEDSSHGRILRWTGARDASKVLDVGCAGGELGHLLRQQGHYVVGIDLDTTEATTQNLDEFFAADLDRGVPHDVTGQFDVVICADVLEHLRRPDELLRGLHDHLNPSSRVIVSVPNFAHWYARVRVASGRFDYDTRGILDATHLRFFTDRTFRKMAERCGFEVLRTATTGLPFDAVTSDDESGSGRARRVAKRASKMLDQVSVNVYPAMFAYQFVYELAPTGR